MSCGDDDSFGLLRFSDCIAGVHLHLPLLFRMEVALSAFFIVSVCCSVTFA